MKRFGFQWPMWSIVLMSSPALAGIPADLLLDNGKILTIDSKSSISSAVVVKDGKILAIGGPEIAKRYTASTVIDLKGRMLLPGFTD